jgi:hypothetical protein
MAEEISQPPLRHLSPVIHLNLLGIAIELCACALDKNTSHTTAKMLFMELAFNLVAMWSYRQCGTATAIDLRILMSSLSLLASFQRNDRFAGIRYNNRILGLIGKVKHGSLTSTSLFACK